MEDDVPAEVKNDRLNRLLSYSLELAEKRYASRVGKTMEVLVEGLAKNQYLLRGESGETLPGRVWTGRTTCNRIVNIVESSPRNLTGKLVDVKITAATSLALQGEVAHEPIVELETPIQEGAQL
jgi:tRNA-2-methylthio-N6-dimethylallyladenosine synthase